MSGKLEVLPRGLLSLDYELREGGLAVGTIQNSPLKPLQKAILCVGGREYAVIRQGVLRASYELRAADGTIRALAERHGLSGSAYLLLFDSSRLLMRKKVLALRETYLIQDVSGEVGRIVRGSPLSRRMTVDLEGTDRNLPREVSLFLVWLALLIHSKDSSGAAIFAT